MRLGRLLGRRDAFNLIAARCSAADAALLRELRDDKLYVGQASGWDEFCTKFLHISKQSANRLIHYLNEFGPGYFEVAQLTRISPTVYRAIAPAVQDHAIQHDGESIALVPENMEKVAAAVAQLRKAAAPPPPAPPADPIPALDAQCNELVASLTQLVNRREHVLRLQASIGSLKLRLSNLEMML